MDIDTLSRLLHEKHITEQRYFALGSRNTYGLTILEAKESEIAFKQACEAKNIADNVLELYLNGDSLESSIKRAQYYKSYFIGV